MINSYSEIENHSQNNLFDNTDKIYEDHLHHFKISYPLGWKEIKNSNNVTFISPLENRTDNFQEKVVLNVEPKGNIDLTNMISLKITEYRQDLNSFQLIDFKKDILGENQGYKIIYSYEKENRFYTNLEIFATISTKTYSLLYSGETIKYSIFLPIINKIFESIEIKDTILSQPKPHNKQAELDLSIDPYSMVANPITNKLYITNLRFHTVSVVDSSNDKILYNIEVGRFPTSIDIDKGLSTIFVANSRSNYISVIDGTTDNILKEIPTKNSPISLVVDDIEKGLDSLVFVVNSESNSISILDGDKVEFMKEEIKTENYPTAIEINPIINRLYVTTRDSDSVSMIDYFISSEGSFFNTNTTTIKVGKYPSGIDVNLQTNKIYVANSRSNTISVIDGSNNTLLTTIPVGIYPTSVEINTETNKIYVSNYQDNSISIINGSNDKIISSLSVGKYPSTLYLNPINDIIYVVNLGSRTISQIDNTSLVTGIAYNINPPNSGQLDCNGNKISEHNYIKYRYNSEIECIASPNPEYEFRSWSTNIPFESDLKPQTRFKTNEFGNITANFQTPVELNLPKDYWNQIRLAIASVVIPAMIGWLFPTIATFINNKLQRKSMRQIMHKIILMQKDKDQYDNTTYIKKLEEIQDEIIRKLTSGKISESQYEILNSKISNLLDNNSR
jgi:YVTN family beta-propeller protein